MSQGLLHEHEIIENKKRRDASIGGEVVLNQHGLIFQRSLINY